MADQLRKLYKLAIGSSILNWQCQRIEGRVCIFCNMRRKVKIVVFFLISDIFSCLLFLRVTSKTRLVWKLSLKLNNLSHSWECTCFYHWNGNAENGVVVSVSILQGQIWLNVSPKLYLNLYSRRWLKPNCNLVNYFLVESLMLKILL